jgi:hypothetical protein
MGEVIRQSRDQLTGQPQERSLIAGAGSSPSVALGALELAGCRWWQGARADLDADSAAWP